MVLTDKDLEKEKNMEKKYFMAYFIPVIWSSGHSGQFGHLAIAANSVIWSSGPPAIPVIPSSDHSSLPVIPVILVIPLGCAGFAFIFFSLQSELK
jgi:hypothetical protein